MKRWLRILVALLEALVVLAAVYFEPSFGVRGRLWGEAFFEGRPTSYWNQELERWQVHYVELASATLLDAGPAILPPVHPRLRTFQRVQSTLERWRVRYFPSEEHSGSLFGGPSILNGDPAARPVLEELLKVGSPKVCALANIGLGIDPNVTPLDFGVFGFKAP